MPKHDLIDIGGGNAGVREGLVGNPDHEAFDGFGVELAERRMRPSDDAGCHGCLPETAANRLERDEISLNHHRALGFFD